MYEAIMIADSISARGKRICTMQSTLPMIVWNEMLTHRVFSRGSASSRAIPIVKMIAAAINDPFIPDKWFVGQTGMQPGQEITDPCTIDACIASWLRARDAAIVEVRLQHSMHVAKEIANRLLGPFLWNTAIITSTEWCNFFNLRCHPMAQRQIRIIAEMMRDRYFESEPEEITTGGVHAPYIDEEDFAEISFWNNTYEHAREMMAKVSSGRSCRVSYLNQDGRRDMNDDIALHDRLVAQVPKHGGALEHFAVAMENPYQWSGNFQGWHQYRKTVPQENLRTYTYNGRSITDLPLQLNQEEAVEV